MEELEQKISNKDKRIRSRRKARNVIYLLCTVALGCAIYITVFPGWGNSTSWKPGVAFNTNHLPFFLMLASILLAYVVGEIQEDSSDVIDQKIEALGAELFRRTGGREMYVFRSQDRIAYLHVIDGDDSGDPPGSRSLALSSHDVFFDTDSTIIERADTLKFTVPRAKWSPTGDDAFDQHFALVTDNPAFAAKILTPGVKAGLMDLKSFMPSVAFGAAEESLTTGIKSALGFAEDRDETVHDFSVTIEKWPKTSAYMDDFTDLALGLLHATGKPEQLTDPGNVREGNGAANGVASMRPGELARAKARVRSRWSSLGVGLVMLTVTLFSCGFISFTRGIEGWESSLSWLKDFSFTRDHVPFFFFFGSALAALYFLHHALQGYRSLPRVAQTPGYIDFDRIRNRWPERSADRVFSWLDGWILALMLGGVLYGVIVFFLWVF
jgi:hypothetical protein